MTRKEIFTIIEKDDGSNIWSYLDELRSLKEGKISEEDAEQ